MLKYVRTIGAVSGLLVGEMERSGYTYNGMIKAMNGWYLVFHK